MADGVLGFGALLKIANDSSPATYVTIGKINSLSGPGIARDAVEVTHMQSPNGYREFIPGLKDGGEVTAEINFLPADAGLTTLLAQLDDSQLSACKITLPTTPAYEWSFDAIVTGLPVEIPMDDKMTMEVTLKVSGKPTLATA